MKCKALILCADDSPYVLEGCKTLLELNGYEVLTASDGNDACQAFSSHSVDLVLLDFHMPGMNGDAAAARMKACKPDVPIAIFSSEDISLLEDVEAVDALISKSEPITKLLEIVDQLITTRFLFRQIDDWGTENVAYIRKAEQ